VAEQYESFKSQAPNVDVSLFVDAVSKGIAQGQALPSIAGSIAQGVNQGFDNFNKTSQSLAGVSATQAQTASIEAQNKVNEDPAVIEAKKTKIEADAKIAQNEAEYGAKNGAVIAETKANQAEIANKESTQKLQKLDYIQKGIDILGSIGKGLSTEDGSAFLNDPVTRQFAREDPKWGYSLSQQASQAGVDGSVVKSFTTDVNNASMALNRAAVLQSSQRSLQNQAIKNSAQVEESTATLQTSDSIRNAMMGNNYDPSKLYIAPSGSLVRDSKGNIKTDTITGKPLVSDTTDTNDKRYIAMYDGKAIDTFDEATGKDFHKAMGPYRLGTGAISSQFPMYNPETGEIQTSTSVNTSGTGLAAQQNARIDQALEEGSPQTAAPSGPSPESLKGTTEQEAKAIIDRFRTKQSELKNTPREFRQIVETVQTNPYLANETPIVKALASQESGGKNDAKSPTNVQGVMQVTGATFNDIANNPKYRQLMSDPTTGNPYAKSDPRAQVQAGKIYLGEQLQNFGDMELALAAYSAAGPANVAAAIKATKTKDKSWQAIKPQLKAIVSEDVWKQVENYPEKVLRFYTYYKK
jgi:hypothetical protein